ncbi:hypothetical protein PVK06_001641 [Gossypium arboreum]|uniref:Uncharacterized protein n=1 Tax=Gossypium arboreum TaxID=29729 RepID=A0ABR0R1P9_GOSAR|nr:hypothetical protein PVK06_001641 [Gossypium arboreum]
MFCEIPVFQGYSRKLADFYSLPSPPTTNSVLQESYFTYTKFSPQKHSTIIPSLSSSFLQAIISIAIEDGNHLQEAWEHILTCLSRIEHLQLLGEGAPTDASFLSVSNTETDDKMLKSTGLQSLKNKGTLQNLVVMAVVRGGSYDSASVGVNNSGLVSPEQINHFIANLNLLEQIGSFELNHVFAHSPRLNSEAIAAFVKALCKVSISEL